MSRAPGPLVAALVLVGGGLVSLTARSAASAEPPDKGTCARAYEQAQRHRQARELKAAKGDLLVCSQPECPAWVRRDCVPWLGEVESAMPSVIVVARHPDGTLREDVRATLDGAALPTPLRGEPVAVDPGEHDLVLEASGAVRIEQRFTLQEGDREHRIDVKLTPTPVERPPPKAREIVVPPAPPSERPVPALFYVLGGFGIAAAGVGTYFQLDGMAKRSDLFACRPSCGSESVDGARRSLWVGNIVLGVSVVSLAAAAWVYLSRPTVEHAGLRAP